MAPIPDAYKTRAPRHARGGTVSSSPPTSLTHSLTVVLTMPRPGSKKFNKKKVKASGAGRDLSNVDIPNVLDVFVDEISDTRGWEGIVRILCRMFELPSKSPVTRIEFGDLEYIEPDFETRSGMKTIHANFPEIQEKLEGAYNKYNGNEKVMSGIVGIWARMSVDSILRDRLFRRGQ